jgi:hypothetical protein
MVIEDPKHSESSKKALGGFLSLNKYCSLLQCGSRIPGTLDNSIKEQEIPDVLGIIPLSRQRDSKCSSKFNGCNPFSDSSRYDSNRNHTTQEQLKR